jgi:bleomycin hydrolase
VFGPGSLGQDVIRVIRRYGVVPEDVYPGRRYGAELHDHSELHAVLTGAIDAVISRRQVSPVWPDAVGGILDAYLGDIPTEFEYEGRTYTPRSFADALGIVPADFVELTSFSHHPFYTWFALEIPDNWARNTSYNVPLDELMQVMDRALENGFSVAWDGDVSETSFCHSKGVAVWPVDGREGACDTRGPETHVTQELRQRGFDNYTSSDDHLMHLTGIARDQDGTKYYITKNSWGVTGVKAGYVFMSEEYVRAKTISILVHADALPRSLKDRATD